MLLGAMGHVEAGGSCALLRMVDLCTAGSPAEGLRGDTGVGGLCLYEFSHQLHFSGMRAPSSLEGSLRVAGLCG